MIVIAVLLPVIFYVLFSTEILSITLRIVNRLSTKKCKRVNLQFHVERATAYLFNNGLTNDERAKFSQGTMHFLAIICHFNPSLLFQFLAWYRFYVQSIHFDDAKQLYQLAINKHPETEDIVFSMGFDADNLLSEFTVLFNKCKYNPQHVFYWLDFTRNIDCSRFTWSEPKFYEAPDETEEDEEIDTEPY